MSTASPWQRPLGTVHADVAIIGGGIVGVSTAYALRRLDPGLRVVLVEAGRLATGASGRNAGFLLLGTHSDYASAVDTYGRKTARRLWAFTQENLGAIREAVEPKAVGLEETGSVIAAGTESEGERLRRSQRLLAEDGVESEWLTADEAERRLGTHGFLGALVVPQGGAVDPARLVRFLARASGAEVLEGWPVERVEAAGEGVRLVGRGGGAVEAERVLVAVNAYLPRLVPALADLVRPVRAQMLATAPAPRVLEAPVYSHDGFYYVRQRPDGRVLVGGARHCHEAEEVGYEDATTPALQADLEAYLREHLPALGDVTVERRWSGTMGFSPDGLPILGDVPDVPGVCFAAGFTGHGMAYGVRFGLLAARRLLGIEDPAADLFRSDRLMSAPRG